MKQHIAHRIQSALQTLIEQGQLPEDIAPRIQVDRTKDKSHGDFASNVAMMLAKPAGKAPRAVAEMLQPLLTDDQIEKIEIAGPGFINFFVKAEEKFAVVNEVVEKGEDFGRSNAGQGASVQVEFVSANPTGPLHVGHGRGAAYGACVADLLEAVGYDVAREYYVNDAGRQMDILATSVWMRYLDLCEVAVTFPKNGYQGDYIWTTSRELLAEHGEQFKRSADEVMANVPADEGEEGGDKEAHIDGLIENAKALLGETDYRIIHKAVLDVILTDIKEDLSEFGIDFQNWFSERSLFESGLVDAAIEKLQQKGLVYEKGGALWFKSTDFGDEKDRVVVRDNGIKTYFASDIAYHFNKLERGFEKIIDVWGADHHGYVPRVKAAMTAMDTNPDALEVLLVQFASLFRGGEKVAMSTRSGQFVTLRELREEVGTDAARFFYVMRKSEQHMDFDLDLAKSQSNENPVYYIQYAHARVSAVMNQLVDKGFIYDEAMGLANLERLTEEHEDTLVTAMAKFPETVNNAAMNHEPHLMVHYLRELAHALHSYYNAHAFIVDEAELRNARLVLVKAAQQTLKNGLKLLGVSAPDSM